MIRRILLAAVAAAALTGVLTGPAAAADQPFAAQARSAGLTTTEARTLQGEVDQLIAAEGGKQIAANRVRWADARGDTTLPLPGEKRARSLSGGAFGCDYQYFCTFRYQHYEGAMSRYYYCQDYVHPASFWSYENNQTGGTNAVFRDSDYWILHTTPGAWSSNANIGMFFVEYLRPC
jgi:hypothetical protein